ncbi:substrate-binding domain-containing protein [Streptomyces sp. NRRL WC-3742]|uniref:substrate-binding domain-containing protein n=1 Tax=Streptomyces sp. NRRL WC-3742 TaxID=1463934 RepID=UPI0004C851BD|nr:substrate-binding domain-containing protein [Streptomyces sp. NRRL WC-3742]
MSATAEERRAEILELVRELGTVRVVDLAERLGLAAVTVRRDVAALGDSGQLRRSHGAVSLPGNGPVTAPRSHDRTVGMLVPTTGSYFDEVIDGARSAAGAVGARLILGIAPYGSLDDRAHVEQLLESGVDGLLITPNWTPDGPVGGSAWIRDLPAPTVLVERRAPADSACAELDSVSSDHHHGVLLALRHLSELGHRSVMLAARTDTWTALQVRAGYAEGARLLGLEPRPPIDLAHPEADTEAVAARIAEGVADGVRAVLVHTDQDAIQLASMLRARGLRVPDDLAMVSYDDVFAALAAPPLTAVAPPKRAVGAVALELLLRRIDDDRSELPVQHVELLPKLKIRTSCGGTDHS